MRRARRRVRSCVLPLAALPRRWPAHAARDRAGFRADRARPLSRDASPIARLATPRRSGTPFAGGRPIETPFGNIVAPNITPDPRDRHRRLERAGVRSRRCVRAAAGRHAALSGDAVSPTTRRCRARMCWRSAPISPRLPPVQQRGRSPTSCRFPSTSARRCVVWNALYFNEGEFKPDPAKSAEWNRGAYPRRGPGSLRGLPYAEDLLGGDKNTVRSAGRDLQGWFAPDITNDPDAGLGGWSVEESGTISRPATTGSRRRPDRWPKRSPEFELANDATAISAQSRLI